ncbi:hypothetical protein V8F33_013085 [Rhypophila sp. PSN 637]
MSSESAAAPTCGFEGNLDTYGLGVRLGNYLSWATIMIATIWFPKIRADLLDATIIFSIALFGSTILVSVNRDTTHSVEIIIMSYLFFGGIFCITGCFVAPPADNKARAHRKVSIFRGVILFFCVVCMAMYNFWFYWIAPNNEIVFLPTTCGTTGTWIFPFGYVDQVQQARRGAMMVYALASFAGVGWLLAALVALVLAGPDIATLSESLWDNESSSYRQLIRRVRTSTKAFLRTFGIKANKPGEPRTRTRRLAMLTLSFVSFTFAVTGTELMLSRNNVGGIYAFNYTGQLIPFVVGVASLIKLFYNALYDEVPHPPLIWGFLFFNSQDSDLPPP